MKKFTIIVVGFIIIFIIASSYDMVGSKHGKNGVSGDCVIMNKDGKNGTLWHPDAMHGQDGENISSDQCGVGRGGNGGDGQWGKGGNGGTGGQGVNGQDGGAGGNGGWGFLDGGAGGDGGDSQ